jgi:hypothetical protein
MRATRSDVCMSFDERGGAVIRSQCATQRTPRIDLQRETLATLYAVFSVRSRGSYRDGRDAGVYSDVTSGSAQLHTGASIDLARLYENLPD